MISAAVSKLSRPALSLGLLAIIYAVGVAGIVSQIDERFILLTPINLLVSLGFMLWNHQTWRAGDGWWLALFAAAGFFIEQLGVHTGLIFGHYQYGQTLGFQLFNVPLMIGVNWLLLLYGSVSIGNYLFAQSGWGATLGKAALGATLMTGLDVLIEPIAVRFDFWTWLEPGINGFLVAPLQNYLAWWLASFVLLCGFQWVFPALRNAVSVGLFGLQTLFFGILNLVFGVLIS